MSLRLPRARKTRRDRSPALPSSELSRHLLRVQEDERRRISRELHDGTGQGLMILRLYLGLLGAGDLDEESRLKVQEALRLLDSTVEETRRIIRRLSPRILEESGLLGAIRKEAKELTRHTGIRGRVDLPRVDKTLSPEITVALYRALQEFLHNVARHSQARQFVIRLRWKKDLVCLEVQDDGVGFSRRSKPPDAKLGLWGIRESIAALGGSVRIAGATGRGTTVAITLPAHLAPDLLKSGAMKPGRSQCPSPA